MQFFYGPSGSGLFTSDLTAVDNWKNTYPCTVSALMLPTEMQLISVIGDAPVGYDGTEPHDF